LTLAVRSSRLPLPFQSSNAKVIGTSEGTFVRNVPGDNIKNFHVLYLSLLKSRESITPTLPSPIRGGGERGGFPLGTNYQY
jgi:hypothetical protein